MDFKDDVTDSVENAFPYRLSPGRRNRSHGRANSTESIQVPPQSSSQIEGDSLESKEFLSSKCIARRRYSCDGRDISRTPPTVDDMDGYYSPSMQALEFSTLSLGADSPSRRRPNVVAKLMGLDDMPESLLPPPTPAGKATEMPMPSAKRAITPFKISSPRPLVGKMLLDMIQEPISVSQAKLKASGYNNNIDRFCEPKYSCSTAEIPKAQIQPGDQNSLLFHEGEKREVEKAVKSVRFQESLCTPPECSDRELVVVMTNPASSAPGSCEDGALPPRSATMTPNRAFHKNRLVRNIIQSKIVAKYFKFGGGVLNRRSKVKLREEKSNAASPCKPASTWYRSEVLPKSDADDKEKRKRTDMEIRLDMTKNILTDEDFEAAGCNFTSVFNLQIPKSKRRLDSNQRQVAARGTKESCKARQRTTEKRKQKTTLLSEGPDQPTPVSVLRQPFYVESNSPSPLIMRAHNFQESEARLADCLERTEDRNSEQSLNKDISKPEEPMDLASNIKLPEAEDHMASTEQNLMDSSESILPSKKFPSNNDRIREFVTEIFRDLGLLKEGDEDKDLRMYLYSSGSLSMDPECFHELKNKFFNDKEGDVECINWRLVLDTVNEILQRECGALPPYGRCPHRRKSCRDGKVSGRDLVNEVVIQLTSHAGWGGDIYDGVRKLLDNDLETSRLDDTNDIEVAEVVLNVERAIFRDLMDQFIGDFLS